MNSMGRGIVTYRNWYQIGCVNPSCNTIALIKANNKIKIPPSEILFGFRSMTKHLRVKTANNTQGSQSTILPHPAYSLFIYQICDLWWDQAQEIRHHSFYSSPPAFPGNDPTLFHYLWIQKRTGQKNHWKPWYTNRKQWRPVTTILSYHSFICTRGLLHNFYDQPAEKRK